VNFLKSGLIKWAAESIHGELAGTQGDVAKLRKEAESMRSEVTGLQKELSRLREELSRSAELVDEQGRPNLNSIWARAKNERFLVWNIKNFGYQMARELAAKRASGPGVLTSVPVASKVATQADIESPWFAYWCAQLGIPVVYHRKFWEYCFLLQTLHDENLLVPGAKGLGFACGQEPIPSYLSSRGLYIRASDQAPEKALAQGWTETREHASSIDHLWHEHLVSREQFDRTVSFEFINMNQVPRIGVFDFCWSICSLEHLGSIPLGLDFIENSLDTLRPGGVAIHTMEYNIDNEGETIDNWVTVLFQRKHIESIAERLARKGHQVAPLNFDCGDGPMDDFIDIPPYALDRLLNDASAARKQQHPSHLKLAIDGFACTCFGLVIRKKM